MSIVQPICRPIPSAIARAVTAAGVGGAFLVSETPVTVTTSVVAVIDQNPATGLVYGIDTGNGHYVTSPDGFNWTDRVYSPSTYTPGGLVGFEFDSTYMYAYTADGKIFRASLNVFNSWTDVSVPDRGPLTTGRPGSLCRISDSVLVYGNYTSGTGDGADIWRTTDAGANWTKVLDKPDGRHVHAIRRNSSTGNVWATIGDEGFAEKGLYKSSDDGATWTFMAGEYYGIDMVFAPADGQRPAMVVMEGDGLNKPLLIGFPEDGNPGDPIRVLVNYSGTAGQPGNNRGTTRGIAYSPAKDVIFFTTTEGGAVGEYAGIYGAAAPSLVVSRLLNDTTGAEPVTYLRTIVLNGIAMNYTWRFPIPQFSTIARENNFTNSKLIGGGASPTGWTRPGGMGTSTPAASTLTQFSDGAVAYEQSATAQRPFLQQDALTAATNSKYSASVYVESVTGTVAINNVLAFVNVPSGGAVQFYQGDTPVAPTATVSAGRIRAVLTTAGTGGSVPLRVGLGASSNATGTVRFSRPQLESRSFSGPFKPT